MKLTAILYRQRYHRWFQRHFYIQGKKIIYEMNAERILNEHGIKVVPIEEIVWPKKPVEIVEAIGMYDPPIPRDKNHPDYKQTPCFIYKDNDVLVQGLNQAKGLTNTVQVSESLPESLKYIEENMPVPDELHDEFRNKIMLACLFEATQKKLPKKKDPNRPMFNFRRDWGLPEERKSHLLRINLINLVENHYHSRERSHIQDVSFSLPFNAFNKLIKFDLSSEISVTSKKPLNTISNSDVTAEFDLPAFHPLDFTISLKHYHFYEMEDSYPINLKSKWPYAHTSIVHYNSETIKNIQETPVREDQIEARSLLKGFTIAGSQAREKYGPEVEELPEPMVTQVIQTNGQWFHFSVFQLNTLTIDRNTTIKNIFWNSPRMWLYNSCSYVNGRPSLVDYNPEVLNKTMAFYKNE